MVNNNTFESNETITYLRMKITKLFVSPRPGAISEVSKDGTRQGRPVEKRPVRAVRESPALI